MGRGGKPRGGSGPRAFWVLKDLTYLARLAHDSQGVAILTNRENWGYRLNITTDGMIGWGGRTPQPTEIKCAGDRRSWGDMY